MTEFSSNGHIQDIWTQSKRCLSYDRFSLYPPFLNCFSDDFRFEYTKKLSMDGAIDESLYHLQRSSPFSFENKEDVLKYIHDNKYLYLAVLDALAAAADIFPTSRRVLSIHFDPDSDDKYLVLSVEFNDYPLNLFELMESIEPRYLPTLEKATSGWISVVPRHIYR